MQINECLFCSKEIPTKRKFCSQSCAAKHNNKGVRRHGMPAGNCLVCGEQTSGSRTKFCSNYCSGVYYNPPLTEEERKRKQRFHFMTYYAKKKNQTPEDADMEKIREIYLNCPDGYEVDHIIPIAKGGLHHQDNLQYLTISENRSKGARLDWNGGPTRNRT